MADRADRPFRRTARCVRFARRRALRRPVNANAETRALLVGAVRLGAAARLIAAGRLFFIAMQNGKRRLGASGEVADRRADQEIDPAKRRAQIFLKLFVGGLGGGRIFQEAFEPLQELVDAALEGLVAA